MYGTPFAPASIQAKIAALAVLLIVRPEFAGGMVPAFNLPEMSPAFALICAKVTRDTGAPLVGAE